MTQQDLERAVASATGESLHVIQRRGFRLADPWATHFDPEPDQRPPQVLDWDELVPHYFYAQEH